jgi:hypothetical protein
MGYDPQFFGNSQKIFTLKIFLAVYRLSFYKTSSIFSLHPLFFDGILLFIDAYKSKNYICISNDGKCCVDSISGIFNRFSINNGALTVTAAPAVVGEFTNDQPYTSGSLTTAKSFSQNQGHFKIRCESPGAQDFRSSFRLLPEGGGGINSNVSLSAGHDSYGMMWTAPSITALGQSETFLFDGSFGTTARTPSASISSTMPMAGRRSRTSIAKGRRPRSTASRWRAPRSLNSAVAGSPSP